MMRTYCKCSQTPQGRSRGPRRTVPLRAGHILSSETQTRPDHRLCETRVHLRKSLGGRSLGKWQIVQINTQQGSCQSERRALT